MSRRVRWGDRIEEPRLCSECGIVSRGVALTIGHTGDRYVLAWRCRDRVDCGLRRDRRAALLEVATGTPTRAGS